jgi:hypothetical protein
MLWLMLRMFAVIAAMRVLPAAGGRRGGSMLARDIGFPRFIGLARVVRILVSFSVAVEFPAPPAG